MIVRDAPRSGTAALLAATVATALFATALFVGAPFAHARSAANPTMNLNFFVNGTLTLTLPDGSPVGTTSGAPTVIPAGYYAIVVLGPGGCTQFPLFDLVGPGEHIVDDMSGGEVTSETYQAYFAPNSTYTWKTDNVNPTTVYTFTTNSTVLGSPVHGTGQPTATSTTKPTSQNLMGSAIAPFRGALVAVVAPGGALSLKRAKGGGVANLALGRYRIAVSDTSPKAGFLLQRAQKTMRALTGVAFVGKRSVTVDLTAGKWLFRPTAAGRATTFVVHA